MRVEWYNQEYDDLGPIETALETPHRLLKSVNGEYHAVPAADVITVIEWQKNGETGKYLVTEQERTIYLFHKDYDFDFHHPNGAPGRYRVRDDRPSAGAFRCELIPFTNLQDALAFYRKLVAYVPHAQ